MRRGQATLTTVTGIIVLVFLAIATVNIQLTRADPPGSPQLISIESTAGMVYSWVGNKINLTLSTNIHFQRGSVSADVTVSKTFNNVKNKAFAAGMSAIAAFYGVTSGRYYGYGVNTASVFVNHDGTGCDWIIHVENIVNGPPTEQQINENIIKITMPYEIQGYVNKTGWACSDQQIPFYIDATSYLVAWTGNS